MPVLSIFGELETFTSEYLYPYRYVITPLMLLAGLAALVLACRAGVYLYLWRHRIVSTVIGAPLVVLALVAGDYLLSPLWERNYLNELSPLEAAGLPASPSVIQPASAGQPSAPAGLSRSEASPPAPAPSAPPAAAAPAGPRTTHRGEFKGADDFHFGRGDALLINTPDGKTVLRFEDFSVRNGPDLYVYLSRDESGRRVDEALNLGRLKATDGAFNYELPPSIDLKDVRSVVVWCRQFTTLFAVAPLRMS